MIDFIMYRAGKPPGSGLVSFTAKDAATDELQHVTHWCLSEAVAVALLNAWSGTALPPVQTPPEPNETSIIEAICADSEG